MKNEIILYQAGDLQERIEVKIEDETVWLSQQQMGTLFQQTKQNISLHINNCFKEGELDKQATVKESLTVQKDVYHLGASLKDLGKRWFAFSKMDKSSVDNILKEIKRL